MSRMTAGSGAPAGPISILRRCNCGRSSRACRSSGPQIPAFRPMVDPYGRVLQSLPLGERGILDSGPAQRALTPTLYSQAGGCSSGCSNCDCYRCWLRSYLSRRSADQIELAPPLKSYSMRQNAIKSGVINCVCRIAILSIKLEHDFVIGNLLVRIARPQIGGNRSDGSD